MSIYNNNLVQYFIDILYDWMGCVTPWRGIHGILERFRESVSYGGM